METRKKDVAKISVLLLVLVISIVILAYRIIYVSKDFKNSHKFENDITQYLKEQNFSGEVLLAYNGKIYYSKGMGSYINMSGNVENINVDTSLPIASLTKSFTGVAIHELQAEGLLSLDDDLTKYYEDYPNLKGITIRDLLDMTSGLDDVLSSKVYTVENPNAVEMLPEILSATAGKKEFEYNNSNYIILGDIIEKVSKQPYRGYIWGKLVVPSAITNMKILAEDSVGILDSTKKELNYDATFSAGGICTSVSDLYRWMSCVFSGKYHFDITAELKDKEYTSGFYKKGNRYFHKGELKYCTSYMMYDATNGIQVIVLSSTDACDAEVIAKHVEKNILDYVR